MINYYCCTQKDNYCPRKEECKRYINAATEPHMTLYKYACTEDNNYLLFMKKETDIKINSIDDKEND